jgi:hypothetical protein
MAAFYDTVLNDSNWEVFLREVAQTLSHTPELNDVLIVFKGNWGCYTFFLTPPTSTMSSLRPTSDRSAAHFNDLQITLSCSIPQSHVLDKIEGGSPHYNGPTPPYVVYGLHDAVQKVISIARETFVQRNFPMDSRHRGPEIEPHFEDDRENYFFSPENVAARARLAKYALGGSFH